VSDGSTFCNNACVNTQTDINNCDRGTKCAASGCSEALHESNHVVRHRARPQRNGSFTRYTSRASHRPIVRLPHGVRVTTAPRLADGFDRVENIAIRRFVAIPGLTPDNFNQSQ
jgi:hypothetical protein